MTKWTIIRIVYNWFSDQLIRLLPGRLDIHLKKMTGNDINYHFSTTLDNSKNTLSATEYFLCSSKSRQTKPKIFA